MVSQTTELIINNTQIILTTFLIVVDLFLIVYFARMLYRFISLIKTFSRPNVKLNDIVTTFMVILVCCSVISMLFIAVFLSSLFMGEIKKPFDWDILFLDIVLPIKVIYIKICIWEIKRINGQVTRRLGRVTKRTFQRDSIDNYKRMEEGINLPPNV